MSGYAPALWRRGRRGGRRYMTLKVNLLELGKTTWPFSLKVPNPSEFWKSCSYDNYFLMFHKDFLIQNVRTFKIQEMSMLLINIALYINIRWSKIKILEIRVVWYLSRYIWLIIGKTSDFAEQKNIYLEFQKGYEHVGILKNS